MAFPSRETLRAVFEESLVRHRLSIPVQRAMAAGGAVLLRLVLPDDAGEVRVAARVLRAREVPERQRAPYDVQLELLDLDATQLERLRRAAHGEPDPAVGDPPAPPVTAAPAPSPESRPPASPVSAAPAPPTPPRQGPARPGDAEPEAVDGLLDALLRPAEGPAPPEAPSAAREDSPAGPPPRERLPEELAQGLTEFTLRFVRSVTKSSYYTAAHREADNAKVGLYEAFTALVHDRPEVTFHAQSLGERRSMLVYGVFDEPTELARSMLKGMAELYIPKLAHFFESNGLVSVSFKRDLEEGEFHRFVDLLATPEGLASGNEDQTLGRLVKSDIRHISLVTQEDRIAGRKLSWRVDMAITRLKKDLSVIPLYEHLGEDELQRIRLQVLRDVVRPLRQVNLIRELLENCDLVVQAGDAQAQENLAEMESLILASVATDSLPALLQGLANDIAEAKREDAARMEQLLRLTRRVAQQLSRQQVEDLENAFRLLLDAGVLSFEELPAFVRTKLAIERNSRIFMESREQILSRFDRERNPDNYRRYLRFFTAIFPELLADSDLSAANDVLRCLSAHRDAAGPFPERGEVAADWLEQLPTSLRAEFVDRLASSEKVTREALLALADQLGDGGVALRFVALRECENAPCRQELIESLSACKAPALRILREELGRPGLTPDTLRDLLELLSRIGEADASALALRLAAHEDAGIRVQALRTAAALDAASCESRALGALDDPDPRVGEEALKLLFEQRSMAPELFAFCRRVLGRLDEVDLELGSRICAGLAGYAEGEARAQSVALLRGVLGEPDAKQGGWWSVFRRAVAGEPANLPVKITACQALGRLRAAEAVEVLTALGKQSDAALRQAAQHALRRIAGE